MKMTTFVGMKLKLLAWSALLLVILSCLSFGLARNIGSCQPPLMKTHVTGYAGGAKRPGLKQMFSAFWLSLVDPSNVESLKNEQKKDKSGNIPAKKSGFFGSKKKGKSLK